MSPSSGDVSPGGDSQKLPILQFSWPRPTVLRWCQAVTMLIGRKWVFKHVFSWRFNISSSSHDFYSPRATKRGPWRLIEVFGSSLTPPWVFNLHPWCFPLFGLMRERIYELEVLMRMGGVIGAWSSCQEP